MVGPCAHSPGRYDVGVLRASAQVWSRFQSRHLCVIMSFSDQPPSASGLRLKSSGWRLPAHMESCLMKSMQWSIRGSVYGISGVNAALENNYQYVASWNLLPPRQRETASSFSRTSQQKGERRPGDFTHEAVEIMENNWHHQIVSRRIFIGSSLGF